MPQHIHGEPIANYAQLLVNFTISDFTVDLNRTTQTSVAAATSTTTTKEHNYLQLIFNKIYTSFAITRYGMMMRAGLGDLQLVDVLHTSFVSGASAATPTRILSSSSASSDQIIKFHFRQVDTEAPNFATLYASTLAKMHFDCSSIQLVCHRTAFIYFIKYAKRITDHITLDKSSTTTTTTSASSSTAQTVPLPPPPQPQPQQPTPQTTTTTTTTAQANVCHFSLTARLGELSWRMFDTNYSFGHMRVSQLSTFYMLSSERTALQVKLRSIVIKYDDQQPVLLSSSGGASSNSTHTRTRTAKRNSLSSMYQQIVTCVAADDDNNEDDDPTGDASNDSNFFDFSLVLYDEAAVSRRRFKAAPRLVLNASPNGGLAGDDTIRLRVGKMRVVFLVKFINELVDFIEPIVAPLTSERVREQAIEAIEIVKKQSDMLNTKLVFLHIDITSPQLTVPQNSSSSNAFLVDLGTLRIVNRFVFDEHTSLVNEILLTLDNVEVKRIVYDRLPAPPPQPPRSTSIVTTSTTSIDLNNNNNNPLSATTVSIREQIVEPINMSAKVRRAMLNMCKAKLADMRISLRLDDLKCAFSVKSAKLMFAILDENLNEGMKASNINNNNNMPSDRRSQQPDPVSRRSTQPPPPPPKPAPDSAADANRVAMQVNVRLRRISLMIVELKKASLQSPTTAAAAAASGSQQQESSSFAGSEQQQQQQQQQSSWPNAAAAYRSVPVQFSHLQIDEIFFDYEKYESVAWALNLKLKDLFLKDVRPASNLAVKEYETNPNSITHSNMIAIHFLLHSKIERMFLPMLRHSYFIEISYTMDVGDKATILFLIDHLKINLCLPYVLKLYQMAMEAISGSNSPQDVTANSSKQQQQQMIDKRKSAGLNNNNNNHRASSMIVPEESADANGSSSSSSSSKAKTTLSVKGRINLPEVVLFAEPEKSNSKILLMNVKLKMTYESLHDWTTLDVKLEELALRLGDYSSYKRQGIQFLCPCSASITMRQRTVRAEEEPDNNDDVTSGPQASASGKKAPAPSQFKAKIGSLYLNMTPTLYQVVMGVINTINKSGTEKLQIETAMKKQLEDAEPFVAYQVKTPNDT